MFVLLAPFGFVTLVVAVAADMGMSLLVTLNALRLIRTGERPSPALETATSAAPCADGCCTDATGRGFRAGVMAPLTLILYVVYLALAFGLRTVLQIRRTGSSGFHGISGSVGSPEWLAGFGFVIALVLGFAAPVLALVGVSEPLDALDRLAIHIAGILLAVGGIAATLFAQMAMGTSWRIGVDPTERTTLVTSASLRAGSQPDLLGDAAHRPGSRTHGAERCRPRRVGRVDRRARVAGASGRGALPARSARRHLRRLRREGGSFRPGRRASRGPGARRTTAVRG